MKKIKKPNTFWCNQKCQCLRCKFHQRCPDLDCYDVCLIAMTKETKEALGINNCGCFEAKIPKKRKKKPIWKKYKKNIYKDKL